MTRFLALFKGIDGDGIFTFYILLFTFLLRGVAGYCPETSAPVMDVGNEAVCRVSHFLLLRNGFEQIPMGFSDGCVAGSAIYC